MTEPLARQVHIVADLTLEVDGQKIAVRGDGQDILVSAPDASSLARHVGITTAAVGGAIGSRRRRLGRLANTANRAGIRVTVIGRTGPVVAIGRDVNVRLMDWLIGSPHVRIPLGRESFAALIALLRHRGAMPTTGRTGRRQIRSGSRPN